ncbi:alpha-glucosidase [Alkalicoccus saliphilus]|jgi:alpha-glucosidase|uniref:Alpha-amylase n=1 Tax=Alkalicoccus saliphilus TaxID=200989 RepID=A0A2T4U2E6_9BACI|nr:alpha-glucosidase [Alkalicoccus saliphilus]PTL37572.1 glucohydrolase [Alkalicoccus saliphilus]
MKKVWWKEAVGYQVYPRSFQDSNGDGFGDLQGMIQRLDYLKDLGIDFIWICPMYKSPLDDNGYDISDYQDILEDFGTMDDFDALLKACHERGMRLIIDLVLNHTSDEHPWFIESREDKDNPKRDWYIWRDPVEGREPNNWESIFGGSAWEYDEQTGQYYLHVFSRRQPDLNWENPEVREALYEMVNWWLDKGVDGFRIDAISHIKKRPEFPDMPNPKEQKYVSSFEMHMNQEGIHTFLEEFKNRTYENYPNAMTVGEANGVSVEEAHLWVGDEGKMDMVFQFEHLDLWEHDSDEGLDIYNLKKVLSRWQQAMDKDGWNALFIENHDKARVVSTWGDDKYYWYESATSLGAMYFLMKGTPFIYQGQEIGMTNIYFDSIEHYDDVAALNLYEEKAADNQAEEAISALALTSRDNSRTPMQWSESENAGFSDGAPWLKVNENYKQINVEKQLNDPHSILSFYRKMIRLRRDNELFVYGSYDLLMAEDDQIYSYVREMDGRKAIIMSNLTEESADWHVVVQGLEVSAQELVLHNYKDIPEHSRTTRLPLRPYETRVYIIEK